MCEFGVEADEEVMIMQRLECEVEGDASGDIGDVVKFGSAAERCK